MSHRQRQVSMALTILLFAALSAEAQTSGTTVCNNGNIYVIANAFSSQCLGTPETVGATLNSLSPTDPIITSVSATPSPVITITTPAAFADFASPGTPGTRIAKLTFTTYDGGFITGTFSGTCRGQQQSWTKTQSIVCPPIDPPIDSCTPDPRCGVHPIGCFWDYGSCSCECSPIVIDAEGRGFHFTNIENGVRFDLRGNGTKEQMAWTTGNSGNAFLALDRNGNGMIDDGTELFGNFTPQPDSQHRNGFLALAEFDKPENGGNGDGVLDKRDRIWGSLLLWIDENHNGISEPNELHTLESMAIESFDLRYREDRRQDAFGNRFKYRARVGTADEKTGKWSYDVYLLMSQ